MAESRQAGTTATPGVLVTGTDTGVGKSLCSVALLHVLRARGLRAVGMKPVASGSEDLGQGLRNEDALALQAHILGPLDKAGQVALGLDVLACTC